MSSRAIIRLYHRKEEYPSQTVFSKLIGLSLTCTAMSLANEAAACMTPCPGSRCMRPRSVSEEASELAPLSEDRIGRSASRSALQAQETL